MRAGALWRLAREVRSGLGDTRPLVVAGDAKLAARLAEGAASGELREVPRGADLTGAAVAVYSIPDAPTDADREALRQAERARVGTVCVIAGGAPAPESVLATDVIRVRPGEEPPLEAVAERIAERAGEAAPALAARVPALRRAVCDRIVRATARQNAVLAVAIIVPAADLPVLFANQARMVLQIAVAHGEPVDRERVKEILGVLGVGFGFRAVARSLVGAVPVAGWAIQGGTAYAGTLALGKTAVAYFERKP